MGFPLGAGVGGAALLGPIPGTDPVSDGGEQPEARLPEAARGPDRAQRVRRTWTDAAVGAPDPSRRLDFNVGNSVRLLRTERAGQIKLALRKRHVRRRRASEFTAKRFLERVGVSQ